MVVQHKCSVKAKKKCCRYLHICVNAMDFDIYEFAKWEDKLTHGDGNGGATFCLVCCLV